MNALVRHGLLTAMLTGGFLAVGTEIAAADANDVSAEVGGATATVPVDDTAVVDVPVVTGTGQDTSVTGPDDRPVLSLPLDTNTPSGTTIHPGSDAAAAEPDPVLGVPVRVREADGMPNADGGLGVTVPVHTAGRDAATGTTVTTSLVRGDVTEVLRDGGAGLDSDGLVLGDGDPGTAPDDVLVAPVSGEAGEPSTVALPERDAGPGSTVSADLGRALGAPGGPVVTASADGGADGRLGTVVVRIVLPGLTGPGGEGRGPGAVGGLDSSHGPGSSRVGDGVKVSGSTGDTGRSGVRDSRSPRWHADGTSSGRPVTRGAGGTGTAASGSPGEVGRDACFLGAAAADRPAPWSGSAGLGGLTLAGLLALSTVLLAATARRRPLGGRC